ncbi:unnamed protein product [Effrenium voratum]|uniref:Uncharacterized protein n=1 Tax=Effrenium voratum TaxID=2562239 RepID=A0AA36N416_9DINO|nr:unnamed protein product [Effrenium voratum]
MAAFSDADSTIVLRHRPDECFRKCFHLESARRVFARWRYLILGQPISGDNGLTTNWATYTDIIAAGFILDPKDITKGTKCILPREKWASLPLELQPPVEQRQGGFEDSGEIGYMKPLKGFKTCRTGCKGEPNREPEVCDKRWHVFSGMEFQPGIFESNEGVKVYREKRPAKAPEEAASQPVSEKA